MKQKYINWNKKFGIEPNDESLEFIMQSHTARYYSGVAIHMKANKDRVNKMVEPAFTLVTKYFVDTTEQKTLIQFEEWLKTNFPSKTYKLIEKEKTII